MVRYDIEQVLKQLRDSEYNYPEMLDTVRKMMEDGADQIPARSKYEFGQDWLEIEFDIRRHVETGKYELMGCAATLRRALDVVHRDFYGVNTEQLERSMSEVNWALPAISEATFDTVKTELREQYNKLGAALHQLDALQASHQYPGLEIRDQLLRQFPGAQRWRDLNDPPLAPEVETTRYYHPQEITSFSSERIYHLLKADPYSLFARIRKVGFERIPIQELERIVLLSPSGFHLHEYRFFGNDRLDFTLSVKRDRKHGTYGFETFQAVLLRDLEVPPLKIGPIDVQMLEKEMAAINWSNPLSGALSDSDCDQLHLRAVLEVFRQLDKWPEGSQVKDMLAAKYLCNSQYYNGEGSDAFLTELTRQKGDYSKFTGEYTAEEAYHLLNDRSVFNEQTGLWVSLDRRERDTVWDGYPVINSNYPLHQLECDCKSRAIRGMETGRATNLLSRLCQGERVKIQFINRHSGYVEADPRNRTVRVYDKDLKMIPSNRRMDRRKSGPSR